MGEHWWEEKPGTITVFEGTNARASLVLRSDEEPYQVEAKKIPVGFELKQKTKAW